jgi:hypothetical protein
MDCFVNVAYFFVVDNKNDIYILRGGYILSSTIKNNDYKHALIL